jgi:hypothetical protein
MSVKAPMLGRFSDITRNIELRLLAYLQSQGPQQKLPGRQDRKDRKEQVA